MFVRTFAGSVIGIDAMTVAVETDIALGIGMYLVGLPDNAVRESQERIRAAFVNSGYRMSGRKIVVNLAPADLRKEGTLFDLPIAVSILAASGQFESDRLERYMILGELSLDGTLRPVKGALPLAVRAREDGLQGIVLPVANTREAAVVDGIDVIGVKTLKEVVEFLSGERDIAPTRMDSLELFDVERLCRC